MRKKAIQRSLWGFPVGITIGYVITIILSLVWGKNGSYSPCVPSLVETVGTEIGAVTLQAALCGLLGASFAVASLIWERDDWSIVKQTGLYFLAVAATMLPIAWFAHWMDHSVSGFLMYTGIFLAIFVFMWALQYCIWKFRIKRINRKVGK